MGCFVDEILAADSVGVNGLSLSYQRFWRAVFLYFARFAPSETKL
jgi:hypothetical protein